MGYISIFLSFFTHSIQLGFTIHMVSEPKLNSFFLCCHRCSIKVAAATAVLLFSPAAQEGQRYPLSPLALFSATLIGPPLPPLLGHCCHPYWAIVAALIGPLLPPLLGRRHPSWAAASALLGHRLSQDTAIAFQSPFCPFCYPLQGLIFWVWWHLLGPLLRASKSSCLALIVARPLML